MKIKLNFSRRLNQPLLLIVRIVSVVFLMAITRWMFYLFNIQSFHKLSFVELWHIMLIGLRFDLSVIAYFNLLFIVLSLLPFPFRHTPVYTKVLAVVYVITNSLLLLPNFIDIIFYRYKTKRTTTEIAELFLNRAENTASLVFQYLLDFWYMFLIYIGFVFMLIWIVRYFKSKSPSAIRKANWYVRQSIWFVFFVFLTVIFARGGFQLKPIGLMSAATYTESKNIPLLINSAFSIIKTVGTKSLDQKQYFPDDEVSRIFSPIHSSIDQVSEKEGLLKRFNVVILINESLGRNYIGYYNPREHSLTPFLDSILAQSITFEGFANGKRSIEALPSILAGIPSLMPADYPSSPFIGNKIVGMGTLLKNLGYSTAFFHGGNNGTMGFDLFSAMAGFDTYFGRNEFGADEYFDGQWGIYDEPFLQFTAEKMNEMKRPFAAGVFTLSSHHPYKLPPIYEESFPQASNEMEASFCYLDHSLKLFFKKLSGYPWFHQTVFIITADHSPENFQSKEVNTFESMYGIPIAFYIPGTAGQKRSFKAEHIDIFPSIMSILGSKQTVFSFGQNLFKPDAQSYILNYLNGMFMIMRNDSLLITNGDEAFELYNLSRDKNTTHNLITDHKELANPLLHFARAVIQQYNNRMIQNRLYSFEETAKIETD